MQPVEDCCPLLQLTDQRRCLPILIHNVLHSQFGFLFVQHLNCPWIAISNCGKGSGFICFSSLNILIYKMVFSGEHRARSILEWGDARCKVTLFSLIPHIVYDHLSLSLSPFLSLSFSTLGFSLCSDPKQNLFC